MIDVIDKKQICDSVITKKEIYFWRLELYYIDVSDEFLCLFCV